MKRTHKVDIFMSWYCNYFHCTSQVVFLYTFLTFNTRFLQVMNLLPEWSVSVCRRFPEFTVEREYAMLEFVCGIYLRQLLCSCRINSRAMQYVYINVIFPELAKLFLCKLSAFIVMCMRIHVLAAMMIMNVGANSISFLLKTARLQKKSTINHHRFHLECIILRKSQISPTAPSHR